jgi:hypothetical protein
MCQEGQHKNKNGYYRSFKTQFEGQLGVGPESWIKRVDPSQCKNKSFYYYSFKTWLRSQSKQGLSHGLEG